MDYIKWIREKVGKERIFLNFVTGCIENHEGQILLQKRVKDKEVWGLPGGGMELGESIEETLKREIKEETGYDIKIDKFIGIYSKYFDKYPNGDEAQTVSYLFKGSITGGEEFIDNKETFDLKFFDKDSMPNMFNKQQQDMLRDYVDDISRVIVK